MSTDNDTEGAITRVTRKGQVTIPKELRDEFGLEPGDEVVWSLTNDGIVVRKANRENARGMLVPEDTSEEQREKVAQELEQRIQEHRESIEDDLLDGVDEA
ncbi:MAG: AbrB family looped-hinge helix DNA binding protein [Halobacteriales archaeon]|jgi:AbrB family looped-hinge helix DNA binding protein